VQLEKADNNSKPSTVKQIHLQLLLTNLKISTKPCINKKESNFKLWMVVQAMRRISNVLL
jgi:hypothetical protein